MTRLSRKKPNLEDFTSIVTKCQGNLSNVAKALNVTRKSIWEWCNSDSRYKDVVEEQRKLIFDKCLATAQAISLGIPDYQFVQDPITGEQKKQMVGWVERPDSGMLRWLMSVYGRDEGFGDHIDVTSNGETIKPIRIVVVNDKNELERLKAEDEKRKEQ